MRARFQFVIVLALLAALAAQPALAQRGRGQGQQGKKAGQQRPPDAPPPGRLGQGGPGKQMPPGKGMGQGMLPPENLPPMFVERLREMPPGQQERFLQNNRRFQMMPPEEQARIRENLRRWNAMTPEQRQEMRARERVWMQMPPEERRRVREEILPRWQQMEPQRRQAIMRRLNALRMLNDEERQQRLQDEKFLQGLSPDDQELLRTLARLRLGPVEPPPQPQNNPPL